MWIQLSDMTQLSNSAEFSIQEQEIGDRERRSTITIMGTQPSDAGAYDCRAMNEPGTTVEQATLTVHGELCATFSVNAFIYHRVGRLYYVGIARTCNIC